MLRGVGSCVCVCVLTPVRVTPLRAMPQATGALYLDDGASFDFQDNMYRLRRFTFADNTLTSELEEGSAKYTERTSVERLVIVGLGAEPSKVVTRTAVVRRRCRAGDAKRVCLARSHPDAYGATPCDTRARY